MKKSIPLQNEKMIEEIYKKITERAEYSIPENAHLCHFFIMPPAEFNPLVHELDFKNTEIHMGYFNQETKRVFSYKIVDDEFEIIPEQEIFQKEEHDVAEVKMDKVQISVHEALDILKKEIKENYPDTVSLKTMIVLQNIITYGFIWNITVMRRDFKTLNLKIDAVTGKVKKISCESLLDLGRSSSNGKVPK